MVGSYFVVVLAYCLVFAFVLFAAVVFIRRDERSVTPIRGFAVFLIAWLGGSIAVYLMHLLFAAAGTQVAGGPLETPIAILTILPIVSLAHTWLSRAKIGS
jgi:hypothetical protein